MLCFKSAYFLARQGGGLKLVKKTIDFGQTGTFGYPGDISPIRIGHDDGIAIESGGTFQGHSYRVSIVKRRSKASATWRLVGEHGVFSGGVARRSG